MHFPKQSTQIRSGSQAKCPNMLLIESSFMIQPQMDSEHVEVSKMIIGTTKSTLPFVPSFTPAKEFMYGNLTFQESLIGIVEVFAIISLIFRINHF